MKFAIIAAGEGSRLAAEGIDAPKPMVKVHGEHLIDRLIGVFMKNNAEEIVVICNDKTTIVSRHLLELEEDGLRGQPVPLQFKVRSTPSSMHSFSNCVSCLPAHRLCSPPSTPSSANKSLANMSRRSRKCWPKEATA